jgi:hypothetical protein
MKSKLSALVATFIFISCFVNAQTTNWHTNGNTTSNSDIFGTLNNQPIIFQTNGVETMRLKPNGDLRINALSGTGNNFVFSNGSGVLYSQPFSADTNKFLTEAGTFRTASSFTGWKMVGNNIHSVSGTFVGIGNTNPQFILDVNGDVHFNGTVNAMGLNIVNKLQADTIKGATLIKVNNTLMLTGGTLNDIYTSNGDLRLQSNFANNGNVLLNVGTSGNVGVGIFTPAYKLDLLGDERVSGKMLIHRIVPLPGDSEIHFGDSSIVFVPAFNRMYASGGPYRGLAIGSATFSGALFSTSIGHYLATSSSATSSVVIGSGLTQSYLTNTIPNSLMVGFNSDVPTLFVSTSSGAGTTGKVGIGTTTPTGDFQVADGMTNKFCVQNDGKIIVGNTPYSANIFFNDPFTKMAVDGRIMCKDLLVSVIDWPDYVFDSTYTLMPLDTLRPYIEKNHHLPAAPSATTMKNDGLSVSENAKTQQQEIENLSLYILQLDERLKALEAENEKLKAQGNK